MTNNKPTLLPCRVCGEVPIIDSYPVQDFWGKKPPKVEVRVFCNSHIELVEMPGFGTSDNEIVEAERLVVKHWNLINAKEND